ncbi:MAG: methyltransferase, partial [Bryobacterales bacterium]|nr:methyltransferase [Bryobacterales bacterium]
MAIAPLFAASLDIAARFGERIGALGLTARFVGEHTCGYSDLRNPLAPSRRAELLDDPDCMALRLLFCDMPLDRTAADEVLGEALCGAMLRHGYLHESANGIRFPFQLRHAGGLVILADYLGTDADAVMGPGETTGILYRAGKPQRRLRSAFDLGCGAGTLALLLARDADRVVGSDINARAVAMAQANAALNGIGNAEFVTGDMYAPVEGQRFDLLLSQPPYYPVKDTTLTFLHSGIR